MSVAPLTTGGSKLMKYYRRHSNLVRALLCSIILLADGASADQLLQLRVRKRTVEAGDCIPINIQGGKKPYHARVSPASLGVVRSGSKFCARKGVHGESRILVTDSQGHRTSGRVTVRGPITRISMDSDDWHFLFGRGMPPHPTAHGPNQWLFAFPAIESRGVLSYLMHPTPRGRIEASALYAKIEIVTDGPVEFDHYTESHNTSAFPAHARFMIQRKDQLTTHEFDRWWSREIAVKLEAGVHEMRVPITPELWSSVYGKVGNSSEAALEGFYRALKETDQIGFTFGGGNYFGHGVRVKNGTATFILREMRLE